MTSVEKRRSGRKNGVHRKHSDGGYSDTSSAGSFLDETDREVGNLTDRAFRSLCIGDEAVYNDSDLSSSSPCTQRDRQLAFNQGSQDRQDREREELKRASHDSFSLRMQQYGQDWIHEGMYGAEIQRDPQWEVYGERTQGRVPATFQHSFVETSQQEESLGEEQLSFLSNGTTELSSQQRRSRSRVSSLIRAFNSEGQRDGAGTDSKPRDWNDETSWDKSALMSIQRELSEFSTSYQQNFNSGQFPSSGSFSSRDTNFYSKVAAVSQMNSASSFMRSSHSKHSMPEQVNCNSNFFIHSEFSPFKVWRDHNRFPFQQGEVSGFMHCSEFPKWYETPMYRELSLEAQPQGPYRFEERGIRDPRNNLAPVVPPTHLRSTSTSTMLQKACAVEKRCESELTGHYPHRKRTQSLGANRLPSQRPSTASPTSEMSRRVQDTISSVKALQQKIKMMTEQNIATGMIANMQGELCRNDNSIPLNNDAKTMASNVVSNNTSTTPFNISQLLTPLVHAHQEAETSEVGQYAVSPQPVEHAPVRAESRGATPDIRKSSYRSRATSLLFNLKDNRKRVKSTYSPTKFKGLETLDKNKQSSIQEPRDTVIDMPDFPDPEFQCLQVEESSRTNAASHQYANQHHIPGLSLATPNSQPSHTSQYSEYTSSDYQTAQMQNEMVLHSGFTGFIPDNYASNQPANGQNLHEDLSSFTPYKQGMIDNVETLGGVNRLKPSYTATETPRLNADNNQHREYLISNANAEQHFNETVRREITKVDRYQQLSDNKHDYSYVSSQDRWRPTNSQDIENLKTVSPWKQEITASMEKDQHAQAYQRAAAIKEELHSPKDKYRGQNQQSINNKLEKIELSESYGVGTSSHKKAELVNPNISNQLPQNAPFSNDTIENPEYYGQQQPGALKDKYALPKYSGENEMKDNYLTQHYNRYADQEYRNQHTMYLNKDKSMLTQETAQRKQYMPNPKVYDMQSHQPIETKPQFEHNMQKSSLSNPGNASATTMTNQVIDRQFVEVKPDQAMAEHIKGQHAQAEMAKAQHWAQAEQPKAESARLILAGQTGSEKVKAELTEHERVSQVKAENIKEEKQIEEQSREKQPERAIDLQTKSQQTKILKGPEGPRNITEEVGAEHSIEEQGEQVNVKQAKAERLKEEHIKTELAKAEQARQARLELAKTEQAMFKIQAEKIEEEKVRADQVERKRMEAEQIRTERVKAEQAEAERRKAEQAKLEQIHEQQAKAEQAKLEQIQEQQAKAEQAKLEQIQEQQAKAEQAKLKQIQEQQAKAEQAKLEQIQKQQAKAEQAKLEQIQEQQAKAEQAKLEQIQEQQAKAEQAKLEQIQEQQAKAEQAKLEQIQEQQAKAEQAKLEQIQKQQAKAEQAKLEQIHEQQAKAEQAKLEQIQEQQAKAEQAKLELIQEQQAKAEQEKTKLVEVGKVILNHIQVEDVKQEKVVEDSIQAGQETAEQPTTQISKAKERKTGQAKLEQTKLEIAKAELTKTDNVQERSAKPSAKITVTQQFKSEPDRVEQVKTELAKAKAELAKIKEKMRGEQKQKVKVNIINNEEYKDQDQATQIHQQREDSVVSRQYSDQANIGVKEYERLREKYGFIDTTSPPRNTVSAAGRVSSNDANETSDLSLNKVETKNNEKSKDQSSPISRIATSNTEHREEVGIFKTTELTESQYVYSELSKEFKLSGGNYLPTNVDKRANSDTVTDKLKDDSVEKLGKCDPLKHTDISQQRDSDLSKQLPHERKPKSTEHSVGPGRDAHFTPPRALSHKERAQTKQEILTSKIKAHAEKEISAIKEKGFAVRDGFISKNSAKQLAGSQNINIRQRPPVHEVSKKHESTMSSNNTPKHQMEPAGIQMDSLKSISPPSSATIPVKSAATTSQLLDHSQTQVPKEPMKSNNNVPKPPRETKQMGSTMSTDECLVGNQKKENQSGIKSPIQSKEQASKNTVGKQEADQGENSKQKKGLKDNLAVNTDHLNKRKEEPLIPIALVDAESSKPEKTESKHKAIDEDSAPSLNLVFGQNESPVTDDSLQITGIMVTVRERQPSMEKGQRNNSTQEQIHLKEKDCNNSELDKCHPSSGLERNEGNTSSKVDSIVQLKSEVVQNTHTTVKGDQTDVGMHNNHGNVQKISTLETRQSNMSETVNVKRIHLQQESSTITARPQRVTQLQEPLAEIGVPSTVTVLAKNKVLAETQPLLYKQDIISIESKDYTTETPTENSAKSIRKDEVKSSTEEKDLQKSQTAHTNENFEAKVMNTAINYTNDPNKADAETLIKHDIQPSVKEDMKTVINPSKSKNIDSKSALLVEEKRYDSTPPKPFNKTSPSNHLTKNENTHVSQKHQHQETNNGKNNHVDDGVHIGSIAIRVMPAVTEMDNLKMAEKHQVTTVSSKVVAANEHKQGAPSDLEENVNTQYRTKDFPPASSEKQVKDSLEAKLAVQSVLSSVRKLSDSLKISNQQNNINAPSGNAQAENGKPERVNQSRESEDESDQIQSMMGDYFQVQGVTESNDEPQNHTHVEDMSDADLPGLLPNKAAISNESCNEGTHEVFVLDQSKRKTVESSSVRVQDENMKRKNRETEDNLASKQSDGPTERQSNKNETEASQAIHIRKHHTENQSRLSARDRQSSRNSHPTKENTVNEKTEVKPKPKERVSTIPEISAIADYARLKVIVSEDEATPIQEFPPNKKEGFFPIIQTRHSRRPVFTADPQDLSVKQKSVPKKTEVYSKVNKEPKPLVFPITEKEHQRTGMFKLGDNERQEKMLLDAKANEGVLDSGAKHAQHLKEKNKSPTHLKNQGREEQVAGTNTQRVSPEEQSIHQPNNTPLQATTSSSSVNRPRSTSVSQHLKPINNSNPNEKLSGKVYNTEESTATPRKDEKIENALADAEERTGKTKQESLATRHEETEAQQQRRPKQFEEKTVSRIKEDKRAEDVRVKHMIEENRASLAEEERRAAQREEERRTREREAIATKIKERREKQRAAERRAEEERAAQKEEEMRAKQREEERIMKETEEKRRIKIEEEQRAKLREEEQRLKENERRRVKQREEEKAAKEEQQRRAAQEEQQRRAAQEEQQRRAAQEEQQRRAAQKEQQRRAAQEEQQRRAAQEEQQRRAVQEEQQRRATQEKQQIRAAEEEKQRAAQEEQQRRAALWEQQRRAAEEEKQRAAQKEQQRRAAQEEQQRRAAQEEQQRRATLIEEQMQAKQIELKMLNDVEENKRGKQIEEEQAGRNLGEEMIKQIQEQKKAEQKTEEQRRERQKKEEWMRTQREEDERRAVEKEKTFIKQREEKQAKEERTRLIKESQAALNEEKRVARDWMLAQKQDEITAKKREEKEEEKFATHREKERATQMEEQKRAAPRMDALQYYAITSTESERKPKERQLCSPLPSQQRPNSSGLGSAEDSGSYTRPYRPHAPASPAPSLPRSNTSSPALGGKPSMFRVKDNTFRGSSLTKSVKPRFHKSFGEDFRVGSPLDRGEEEQEIMRRSAGTPVYPDTGLNRLAAIKESSTLPNLSQDYSAPLPQHRPYSRRSIALDEDDSRSVISNMSEDVESFATSAADLADIRGLYDSERPESACSFSSDVSRSLGKPPTVPPKSEKALRRAQRLTTRRIKKELSKSAGDSPAGVEKSLQEGSSSPSSSSIEVRSNIRQAVASPHFSSPVSLAHAPTLGSGSASSHTEHQSSHSYASPHATGPISLAVASPHATAPVSIPVAPPNATGPVSHTAVPRTVAHVSSSPTLHHATHPAPVTQYHVEASYPHSYPLTQRKVLQDLGSGQYFVVDVPVPVKTKTFFDPETGKYVQLNVRESGQSTSRAQPQQTYTQPQLQPQMQVKLQQQPQASPAGKPFVLYQGNHGYSQDYQPPAFHSAPCHSLSAPVTLHQDQQPVRENHSYGNSGTGQNSEGHRYSPEKTPYMDTVNDKDKTYNTVYNTHESFPEFDTNSQLAGSSVCENDNSAHSQSQPRDIITIGELEDFMEVSDW